MILRYICRSFCKVQKLSIVTAEYPGCIHNLLLCTHRSRYYLIFDIRISFRIEPEQCQEMCLIAIAQFGALLCGRSEECKQLNFSGTRSWWRKCFPTGHQSRQQTCRSDDKAKSICVVTAACNHPWRLLYRTGDASDACQPLRGPEVTVASMILEQTMRGLQSLLHCGQTFSQERPQDCCLSLAVRHKLSWKTRKAAMATVARSSIQTKIGMWS